MNEEAEQRLYFDNAATSWPKPPCVAKAVADQIQHGAAAGRGGYARGQQATSIVNDCRREVASLLKASNDSIAFTANGTHALNAAIHGLLKPGDHVVATQIEHNSVLRPLHWLCETQGVCFTVVPCDASGFVNPDDIETAMQDKTRLVIVSHASNVTGAIQDVAKISEVAHRGGALLLVDAAQSLGHVPVDVCKMEIDLLAAPAHKGCLGPLGTGILYVADAVQSELNPFVLGGTGSDSFSPAMPELMPSRIEAGNLNVPAIAGLRAALRWRHEGSESSQFSEMELPCGTKRQRFVDLLSGMPGVGVVGISVDTTREMRSFVDVVSLIFENFAADEIASILDLEFGIEVRAGLHCAPKIHAAIGSENVGTVRFSFGCFTSQSQIERAVAAIGQIVGAEHTTA